jgi:hypothetical protein
MSSLMCGPLGSEATHNREGESILMDQSHTQHQENTGAGPAITEMWCPYGLLCRSYRTQFHALPGLLLSGIAAFAGFAAVGKGGALTAERWRSSPEGSDPSRSEPFLG